MKKLYLVGTLSLLLFGTFIFGSKKIISEGKYSGKAVEAEWVGLIFKSCEGKFQMGEQSSTLGYCSSSDKELCDKLKQNLGKQLEISYIGTIFSGFERNTGCILKEIK